MTLAENRRARFLIKVKKTKTCWLWKACGHKTGYGRFGFSTKNIMYAHRASWLIFKGKIPKGLWVLHKCDVRLCVNPRHLFLGTPTANMRDASKKKRVKIPKQSYASDETHQPAKLTNKQVIFIRKSRLKGVVLARRFKVCPTTISYARNFKSFKDV